MLDICGCEAAGIEQEHVSWLDELLQECSLDNVRHQVASIGRRTTANGLIGLDRETRCVCNAGEAWSVGVDPRSLIETAILSVERSEFLPRA
jgi:hypothetical protein